MPDPVVIPANDNYKGKTYSQWIAEWCNWFYMTNPDQYNNEPYNDVKFLRSFPSPEKITSFDKDKKIQYEGSPYRNNPNIMIGTDKVIMYEDQAIFFPVLNAMYTTNAPNIDFGYMERWVKQQNSNSDDPPMPHQFTINGKTLFNNPDDIAKYKIDTDGIFNLRIPDAEYGTSLKDFVIEPLSSGWYLSYCQGYYFMVTKFEPNKTYFLFSIAKGAPYGAGEYHATMIYEIKVLPRSQKPIAPIGTFSENILDIIRKELNSKVTEKDIDQLTCDEYIRHIKSCQDTHLHFIESKRNLSSDTESKDSNAEQNIK